VIVEIEIVSAEVEIVSAEVGIVSVEVVPGEVEFVAVPDSVGVAIVLAFVELAFVVELVFVEAADIAATVVGEVELELVAVEVAQTFSLLLNMVVEVPSSYRLIS
jgi:hypothetical protein